ncbi:hypothetical protein A3D77_01595 [Candidatus Gottesmanbacteria bacterium RIFCSPHIGHO2_02_FULL_39_11]|uniref:Acetyl-CoA acetyltransferase n=1 Tax=Candidatus Gottesmanbacteria bacterium RIFCSPHIGHO2_02_FULL_39_11 TaxID=1798382 RepID=A0A1F5ZUA4_9BACT|nr:MAG: hypothetical protein A3D77_01595 [Candidatus Gottesmanbacteria bacterium RIFCSPHIGHO2_02_FULL_39_11]
MTPVRILSGAVSKFGELWDVSPRDLVKEVVQKALTEAGLTTSSIDGVFVGNMLAGTLGNQDHLGAFFSEELGIFRGSISVEGACASGGLAVHSGVMAILSELYHHVLVIGVEKMTDHKPEDVAKGLMGAGSSAERESGATFPSLYALMAVAHMEKYGTTEEQMAAVSVKNHFHASLNPNAQFHTPITIEQVMKSSCIASPLKLLDCSPITDGAAAIILSKNKTKNEISIIASSVETDTLGVAERESLTSLASSVHASKEAYAQAGIKPSDIDVAEVHDCFSIAEILAMEDLGFFQKGEAAEAIFEGKTKLGSKKLVVNTSGGLKASGHPVGATGVKQIVEIYEQLKGKAGKRQVDGAKIGLTHNVGGSGATAVIHILRRN